MDFIATLQAAGFSYVSVDMASGVTITAWRCTERKTYQCRFMPDLASAVKNMLGQIQQPAPAPVDDFEDLLG